MEDDACSDYFGSDLAQHTETICRTLRKYHPRDSETVKRFDQPNSGLQLAIQTCQQLLQEDYGITVEIFFRYIKYRLQVLEIEIATAFMSSDYQQIEALQTRRTQILYDARVELHLHDDAEFFALDTALLRMSNDTQSIGDVMQLVADFHQRALDESLAINSLDGIAHVRTLLNEQQTQLLQALHQQRILLMKTGDPIESVSKKSSNIQKLIDNISPSTS